MADYIIILKKDGDEDEYEEVVPRGEISNEIEGIGVLLKLSRRVKGRTFKLFRIANNGEALLIMELKTGTIDVGKAAKCRLYIMA